MPTTPAITALGPGGWLGLLAVLVGFVVRLLKTDALNTLLGKFSIPPIPKKVLPWIALVLGAVSGMLEAKIGGADWKTSAISGVWGVFSGAGAVAGNETMSTLVRSFSPALADLIFGKNSGPDPGPAAPSAS
jgi:hypothetical protein